MSEAATMDAIEIEVPGDKSITHRALLFGALATGTTRVRRHLVSADIRSTASALRLLGVGVPDLAQPEVVFTGVGLTGLKRPSATIDCGNSGTTARLILGILAAQSFASTLSGDESLRSRPMERVTDPLTKMGAQFEWLGPEGRFPLTVHGRPLRAIDIETGVASAQVKSALLLAGLASGQFALITEPRKSRDHTERMLSSMGVSTVSHAVPTGWRVELRDPPEAMNAVETVVPGDFSTAAFPLVWAICREEGAPLALKGVGLNPTRTGLLTVLRRMGATIEVHETETGPGEPMGTLVAYPSQLVGTEVGGAEIPAMVDEIPALVIAALHAEGRTHIHGAGELRVKESDRIDALCTNLRAIGAGVEEAPDGLTVQGKGPQLEGVVETFHDHRVEMAFGVLEILSSGRVQVASRTAAEVSFPAFWAELARLQQESDRRLARNSDPNHRSTRASRPPVVTIDGPAGSGKSTTARAVARSLGLVHLDSGALYRAVAMCLLVDDVPSSEWERLSTDDLLQLGLTAEVQHGEVVILRNGSLVQDADLRTPEVTAAVSQVAALPAVRASLIDLQRSAAAHGGLVVDGRDMGTVVFPDADIKFFFMADLEERARRRVRERVDPRVGDAGLGEDAVTAMAQKLNARDFQDTQRTHSPLRRPTDAIVIDTTHLSPDEQLAEVLREIRQVWS